MTTAPRAIRFIVSKNSSTSSNSGSGAFHLLCRVKPGASSQRAGVAAVTDDAIELNVAARAREGEANRAVREMIAEVLGVAKSDLEIAKGLKSREKTVVVSAGARGLGEREQGEEEVRRRLGLGIDS